MPVSCEWLTLTYDAAPCRLAARTPRQRAERLLLAGATVREVACQTLLCESTVRVIRDRLGVPAARRGRTERERASRAAEPIRRGRCLLG